MSIYNNINFKPTWLYIKQHNQTKLKYLGKTTVLDPNKYKGSGKYWRRHLNVHGNDVSTTWKKLFSNKEELVSFAIKFSHDNNIVESNEWANLIEENGLDGGSAPGKIVKESTKLKIANARLGTKRSIETRDKLSKIHSGKKRKPLSIELKQKLSQLAKNRIKTKCPYCGILASGSNYTRSHGNKCKLKIYYEISVLS